MRNNVIVSGKLKKNSSLKKSLANNRKYIGMQTIAYEHIT